MIPDPSGTKGQLPVLQKIIAVHGEEAAILWNSRRRAVSEAQYTVVSLAELDEGVDAHLDGLRIAGEAGWKLCEKQLESNGGGEFFVAGVLVFESGDPAWIAKVLDLVEERPELGKSLISALGWLEGAKTDSVISRLLASPSAIQRRIGLAGCAIRRQNPGEALSDALRADDPLLNARSCKAIGELGRKDLVQETAARVVSERAEVRFYAAWSATILTGHEAALTVLRSVAQSPGLRQ